MNPGPLLVAALAVATVALPAHAQPALSALIAPRASELADAGVQRITARTGKDALDIQILTEYGPAYFGWPKNVTPVPFEIAVGAGNAVTLTANDYSEADKAHYAAAFDAVIPRALAQANGLKAQALRPRP
jgi:hypothetical protein